MPVTQRHLWDEVIVTGIAITESWGKEWISDGIFSLPGFSLYRNDRDIKQGGGTLLYINDKLEHRACRPLNTPDSGSSVWCWVIEKKNGKKNSSWECLQKHVKHSCN